MKNGFSTRSKGMQVLCFFAVVSLLLISSGCTQQPAGSPATPVTQVTQATPAAENAVVTVSQPDSTHILITYPGSPQTDNLVELAISITDRNGKVITQSMGSRLGTTPVRYGATQTITGSFDGKDRVYITGFFSDGSQKPIIDTTL